MIGLWCLHWYVLLVSPHRSLLTLQIMGLLWPILQICAVKFAGGGKHMYDVTYHEIYMANWVCNDTLNRPSY